MKHIRHAISTAFVLDVEVTPGNVHDSVAFDDVYDKVVEQYPEVTTVVADSAYKTPHICKKVFEDGRGFCPQPTNDPRP